jgi:hypothetical protein
MDSIEESGSTEVIAQTMSGTIIVHIEATTVEFKEKIRRSTQLNYVGRVLFSDDGGQGQIIADWVRLKGLAGEEVPEIFSLKRKAKPDNLKSASSSIIKKVVIDGKYP